MYTMHLQNFLWQRDTPLVEGWFIICTWKNNIVKFFIFYIQLINVAAGCIMNPDGPHGPQVGDPRCTHIPASFNTPLWILS